MPSSIVSQQSLGLATDSQSGLVSTTTQTFAGNKTFNGQILTPNRIAFNVGSNTSCPDNSQQTYEIIYINNGSNFSTSTSRFTAPIAGTYYFEWSTIKQSSNSTAVHRQYIRKNGVDQLGLRHLRLSETNNYGDGTCSAILQLNQNDYIEIYIHDSSIGSHAADDYTWFQGFLIG